MTVRATYAGPWRVDLEVRPGVFLPIARSVLVRTLVTALEAAGATPPASIGLILTDDGELAALNAQHMGSAEPTDVLSFPLLPPGSFPAHRGRPATDRPMPAAFPLPPRVRPHLGDIVVSVERAIEQAEAGRGGQTGDVRWTANDELRLLVAHGTLHVCGWDHADPDEGDAMRALEHGLVGDSSTRDRQETVSQSRGR